MGGRIDIETNHVSELLGELRIGRQLERPDAMRRELVGLENALDRSQTNPRLLGQNPPRPVGGLSGRRPGHQVDDPLHGRGRQRRLAGLARLVAQQPVDALRHKPRLPGPHHRLRLAGPAHNLVGADTVCAQQDDLGPPDMLMRCVAIPYDRAQTAAINRLESNGNSGSHAPDLHATSQTGIPSRIQMSDLIH